MIIRYLKVIFLALLLFSCNDDKTLIDEECSKFYKLFDDSISYQVELPDHIIKAVRSGSYYDSSLDFLDLPSNTRVESFIDDNKAKLGRVLFYDSQLSIDNTVSCSSCHIQENSFAEPRASSIGINNLTGTRNAMNLENVIFYPGTGGYGWGEGSAELEDQIKAAIFNSVEMGMVDSTALVNKILDNCYYDGLFYATFGSYQVTTNKIYQSLAHFIGSMNSYDSKYDLGRSQVNNAKDDFSNFTHIENLGKTIFIDNCSSCHSLELFKGFAPANIGLDMEYEDKGFGTETGNSADNGKFKTPSLRNIMVTAPYMHDGRFETIDDVLAFYSDSIQSHPNLAIQLKNESGSAKNFEFKDFEIKQLKAFLETLNDEKFLHDEKYANPF